MVSDLEPSAAAATAVSVGLVVVPGPGCVLLC